MKKLIATIAILGMGVLICTAAHAISTSDTIGVVIGVNEVFSLQVIDFSDGDSVLDLGIVDVGGGALGDLMAYCGTNRGFPWTLQIKSTAIIGGSTGFEIPLAVDPVLARNNFEFWSYTSGDQAGNGTVVSTATLLSLIDQTAYTSGLGEDSDTDVRVSIGCALNVPFDTPTDTYGATLTITMTE